MLTSTVKILNRGQNELLMHPAVEVNQHPLYLEEKNPERLIRFWGRQRKMKVGRAEVGQSSARPRLVVTVPWKLEMLLYIQPIESNNPSQTSAGGLASLKTDISAAGFSSDTCHKTLLRQDH